MAKQSNKLEMDARKTTLELFAKVRKITNTQPPKQRATKSKKGKLLTEPAQINSRWQVYCSELYKHITIAYQQALNEIVNNNHNLTNTQ